MIERKKNSMKKKYYDIKHERERETVEKKIQNGKY